MSSIHMNYGIIDEISVTSYHYFDRANGTYLLRLLGRKNKEVYELSKGHMTFGPRSIPNKIKFLNSAEGITYYENLGVSLQVRDAVISIINNIYSDYNKKLEF